MRALVGKTLALLGLCGVFVVAWNCIHIKEFSGLSCNPRDFEFGDITVGSASEMSLELTNPSQLLVQDPDYGDEWEPVHSTVMVSGFSSLDCGPTQSPFSVVGPFPLEMEQHDEASVIVRFTPTAVGEWDCTMKPEWTILEILDSRVDVMPQGRDACTLHLTGHATGAPECTLPSTVFEFPDVEIGGTNDLTLTIINATPDPIATNQFKYVLENPTPDCRVFRIDAADTAGVIGPGGAKDIVVRFAPDAPDDFECTRSLASLKEPADPADPYIANACPSSVTWRGRGIGGTSPGWNSCSPAGTNDWYGVSGVSGSEIYVAGNGGSVIASGGDCEWFASGSAFLDVDLKDIWAHSDGASTVAWAVGNIPPPPGLAGETGAILRMDGTIWGKVDEGTFVTYGAVWGSAFDDVYFVGTGISTDFPNAKHWDGSTFGTLNIDWGMSELTGVSGNAADDIWAVLRQQMYSVYHYDGSQWTNETQQWMSSPLHDVWTVASSGFYQVYAVGEDGAIYHFDGTHWTDESIAGEDRDFYGVWVSATGQVFVVGEGHVIYQFDGSAWHLQSAPPGLPAGDFLDVWGVADDDVYAVGTGGVIIRYTAQGG